MSIVVGKRTFNESFSNLMISDFPRESLYRSKMVLNETNALNRGNFGQIRQDIFNENIKILKQNFLFVDEKEIHTILEDCDGNLEIASEILQKSQQPKIVSPLLIPVTGRTIRKLQPEKEAPPKETTIFIKKKRKNKTQLFLKRTTPLTKRCKKSII
jgi:hypothetical protein